MWGRSGQKCPVGAKFPPFGGASIASGYTPDALAGAGPGTPLKGSPQNRRFCGERRSSKMSESCHLWWDEGYGACDDEMGRKESNAEEKNGDHHRTDDAEK